MRAINKVGLPRLAAFYLLSLTVFWVPRWGLANDGEKIWNFDGVCVSGAFNDQQHVCVTSDGAGGAIIAWQDERTGEGDIYARRVDNSGNTLWTADGVAVSTAGGNQLSPEITGDGAGGAIITWWDQDETDPSTPWRVFAQRIDGDGAPQWPSNGVQVSTDVGITPTILPLNPLSITTDMAGGAFIVFEATPGPRVVHIDEHGTLLGPGIDGINLGEGVLTCGGPDITSDGAGGAILAWANGLKNIVAQRVTSDLSLLWGTSPVVVSNDLRRESRPNIIGDSSGGAFITWARQPEVGDPPNTQVVVQKVDGGGNAVWASGGVVLVDSGTVGGNSYAWKIYEVAPTVASDGQGGAIIAWNDWRNESGTGGNDDIFAQRINADGTPEWTENGVSVHLYPGGSQRRPQVSGDGTGGAIVAFQDMGLGSWDIYAVGLDAEGTAWRSYVYYGSEGDQTNPEIVFDGTGADPTGAVIAWDDERGSHIDIYAQKLEVSVSESRLEVGPPGSGYPYTSIQTAIDDANAGSVVLLHDGTYVENINFNGRAITVRSKNGADAAIIDGDGSGAVVSFSSGEGAGSVLEGITIRNGSEQAGGGIRCNKSSPTIRDCVVVENTATYLMGGGIYCYKASPTITNCIIAKNKSTNPSGRGAGGIGAYGGSAPVITNCTLYGNEASANAGGIVSTASSPTVVNSILWGNSANGELSQIYLESTGSIDITYSNVQHDGGNYPGVGNINQNPELKNPAGGNFHLLSDSPCIDSGSNTALRLPGNDFDGEPRITDGNDDGTPTADMGVDEYLERPDLIVESILTDPLNPKPYEPFSVYVTIRNQGTANIPGTFPNLPFKCGFNSGTKPYSIWQTWNVYGLDAGEKVVKEFDFPAGRSQDTYTLAAKADWDRKVNEMDEENNYLTAPLIVDPTAFEMVLDKSTHPYVFGGTDRAQYKPLNNGIGQSFIPQSDCAVNKAGFKFSKKFDYPENPTGHDHEVTLILNVRSNDGSIIDTAQRIVPADFDDGWVLFDLNVVLEGRKNYIFTCYLKDGEILEYCSGAYMHEDDLLPHSEAYVGYINTIGGGIENWIFWYGHPYGGDFNFRVSGIHIDICEGDFEPRDGDVDGSDLAVFAADFGRTDCGPGDPCEGDFDDDGDVDGSDLATFAADFGRTDCPE